MKKWIIGLASAALLAIGAAGAAHTLGTDPARAQAEARITLHVDGMYCATCPITVRVAVGRLPGVCEVTVSLERAEAVVVYDPTQVTPAQIIEAIEAAGYHARLDG